MVPQNRTESPGYPINSVDKALRLLLLLRNHELVTVSQAGAALGVARSTAHRLLAMLSTYGFASQDEATKAYRPGRVLLEIGLAAVGSLDLRNVARGELEALSREVGETVHLVVLEGPRTLVLDSVESTHAVRVSARTGGSMPPHCTSAGKVLLAGLAPERVVALLGADPLPALTPASIVTHAALASELERVREAGYATNFGENEPGLAAVSVAIPAPKGARPAAITVSAPSMRLSEREVPAVAAAAGAAAARIGERLGE